MANPTSRIALSLVLFLSAICVDGQQAGDQKKRVPAMSSDDTDAAPSTSRPMAGSAAGATAGLTRYSPESCGLSIELPREPHGFDVPPSQIESRSMGSVRVYQSAGDDYTVSLRHYELPRRRQPSPEECVKTFFRAVEAGGIFRDLNYTLVDQSHNRVSFRVVTGEELGRGFEGFALAEGRHAWVVFAVYSLAKSSAVQQVKSILASARLDGPPCTE